MDIWVAQNHNSLPCVQKDMFILKEDNNRCLQGTVLFNIFVNNLKLMTESTFLMFAGGLINMLEARAVVQRQAGGMGQERS